VALYLLKPIHMQNFPFKKMFFATTFFIIPFSILESFLALFTVVSVNFNDSPRTGWVGFIIPILFIPFLGFMFSGINWVVLNVGYWFYSLFFKSDKNSN
jgi:hypothetical protein